MAPDKYNFLDRLAQKLKPLVPASRAKEMGYAFVLGGIFVTALGAVAKVIGEAGNWLSVALIIVGASLGFFGHLCTRIRDAHTADEKQQTSAQLTEATHKVASLTEDLAAEQERNRPRVLSPEQQEAFRRAAEIFRGTMITVYSSSGDLEANKYSGQFIGVLKAFGHQFNPATVYPPMDFVGCVVWAEKDMFGPGKAKYIFAVNSFNNLLNEAEIVTGPVETCRWVQPGHIAILIGSKN